MWIAACKARLQPDQPQQFLDPLAIKRCRVEVPQLLSDGTGHATACHRTAELPPPEAIVPVDGGFSPTLEKLVAAFSGRAEGPARAGGGISGT